MWLRSCFDSVLGRRRGSQTGPSSPGHARRPPLAFALSLPLQTWHLHLDVTTEEHLPLSPGGLAPIYGLVLLHPRFTKIQTMSKIETAYSPPTHDPQSTSASGARSGEPRAPGDAWGRRGRPGRGGGECPGCPAEDSPKGPALICMRHFLYFVSAPTPLPI